jgi:hypothetical protein
MMKNGKPTVEDILGTATSKVPSYEEYKELKRAKFRRLADKAIELKATMDSAKAEYDKTRELIESILMSADAKTIAYNGWQIGITEGRSAPKFDKQALVMRLLAEGVSDKVIKAAVADATTPGKEWTSVALKKLKED